jgi:hypothetical protein
MADKRFFLLFLVYYCYCMIQQGRQRNISLSSPSYFLSLIFFPSLNFTAFPALLSIHPIVNLLPFPSSLPFFHVNTFVSLQFFQSPFYSIRFPARVLYIQPYFHSPCPSYGVMGVFSSAKQTGCYLYKK